MGLLREITDFADLWWQETNRSITGIDLGKNMVLWTEAQTSIHSTNGIKEKKGAAFQEQNIFTVICYVIKVKLRQYLLSQQDYDPQWASALKYKL